MIAFTGRDHLYVRVLTDFIKSIRSFQSNREKGLLHWKVWQLTTLGRTVDAPCLENLQKTRGKRKVSSTMTEDWSCAEDNMTEVQPVVLPSVSEKTKSYSPVAKDRFLRKWIVVYKTCTPLQNCNLLLNVATLKACWPLVESTVQMFAL